MAAPDLTDDERRELIALLRRVIAADPFPLSPRVRLLRGILDKLQPPSPRAEPSPPPKSAGTPSLFLARKKGRRR